MVLALRGFLQSATPVLPSTMSAVLEISELVTQGVEPLPDGFDVPKTPVSTLRTRESP